MENGNGNGRNGIEVSGSVKMGARTVALVVTLTSSGWIAAFFSAPIADHFKPRYESREIHRDIGAQILDALPSYTYRQSHYWMRDGRPTLAGLELHMQLLPGTLDRKGLTRDIAWELFVTQRALLERRKREREKPTEP